MEKEKLQHYSIRKLSVGAASVLIGLSFVGMGHSTQVKADTVNENQQQVDKTPKNENISVDTKASPDNNQTSDGKNNLNDDQTQNKEKVTKITASQKNVQEGKQLNISSTTNETPKSTNSLRSSENKAKKDTVSLNSKIAPKVTKASLAEAKVETQDNNDLNVQKDPSKLSADKFANGTRWTPAGWTRTDKNTKTAKSSSFSIDWRDQKNIDNDTNKYLDYSGDVVSVKVGEITFTIDKNDMKQGNSILINTIQQVPTQGKQASQSDLRPALVDDSFADMPVGSVVIKDKAGQDMGYLTVGQLDNAEVDLYFHPTKTLNNLAIDPTFSYDFSSTNRSFFANYVDTNPLRPENYSAFYNRNHHLQFPLHYSVLTSSDVLNYDINFSKTFVKQIPSNNSTQRISNWRNWDEVGQNANNTDNQINNNKSIPGFVYKIQAIHGNPITITWAGINSQFNVFDANGNLMSEQMGWGPTAHEVYNPKQEKDNLNSTDLWNITPDNEVRWSKQSDGSVFVCSKLKPIEITPDIVKQSVNSSYLGNIQDPEHYQQILDNTLKNTKSWGYYDSRVSTDAANIGQVDIVTDVTPSFVGTPNLGTFKFTPGYQDGNSQAELELYRNASVNYIDDTTKQNISNDLIIGRKNQSTDYTVNIPSGYVLADNQNGTSYKWDDNKTKITYTFADDQKQNDANPIVIHLKHGQKDLVDSNVISETVHYQFEDGSKAADDYNAKHVVSSRIGHKDLVTGETVWDSDWSKETFPEVNTPHINGYTADLAKIDAQNVDGTSQDIVKTVVYKANDQKIFVHYIDDDVNGQDLHTDPLVGKSNTVANYTTGDAIKNYLNLGYDLVSDETQGKALKYDADDEHDQVYNVHLKHHISDVTDPKMLNATFDRVITETLPDGKQKQITQHYVITRTGKQDQVTKKYAFTNWSSAQVHEDKGDALDGYTAKINSANIDGIALVDDSGVPTVKAEKFTNENNNSTTPVNVEERVEVGYLPNDQKATITFIDDDAQKDKQILQTQNLVGKSNTKSSYDTGADIENYLSKGFELVSDDTKGNPITFDAHDKVDQVFTVHLKHHISDVTDPRVLTATFDRVITEHTPDGKDKQITQHYVITRTGKQDQVTKKYAWSDWTTVQVHEDKGDTFEGYTPHLSGNNLDSFISLVNGTPIAKEEVFTNENGKLLPKNISEKVDITYTANPQEAAIVFYDDTADTPLQKNTVRGHYGEAIEFTPKVSDVITEYTKKGYVLVSNEFDNQKYAADDKQNVFVVHLKHGTVDVTRSKDVTETIHYIYDNDSKAHDDYVATKQFVNHGTKDLVTGNIVWQNAWTPANDEFAQVNSPEIPGYTPDKSSIPAQKVNVDSKNLEFTVKYSAIPAEPSSSNDPEPSNPVPEKPIETTPDTPVSTPDDNISKEESSKPKKHEPAIKKASRTHSTPVIDHFAAPKKVAEIKPGMERKAQAASIEKSSTVSEPRAKELPTTGEKDEDQLGYVGLALASLVGIFGYSIKKRED